MSADECRCDGPPVRQVDDAGNVHCGRCGAMLAGTVGVSGP